jgi:hypothetical protein
MQIHGVLDRHVDLVIQGFAVIVHCC